MTKKHALRLASVFSLLLAFLATGGTGANAAPALPDLGANVLVFDPSMSTAEIQAAVDAIAAQQVDNEFGEQRYALLFKPGTYGSAAEPLILQVGYYTEVAGLGALPTDVTINGHVDVYNRCLTPDNCIALNNFWRSLSNLTVNVMGLSGCRSSATFWAVSQAAPMRRVNVTGGTLSLMDYCTAGPQYASGGFIADSQTGLVVNGSQQQFLVRDSSIGAWSNGVWNQVFSGVTGAPAQSFPSPPYTTLATSPVTRERPFLTYDASNGYSVVAPTARTNSSGTTWSSGPTAGSTRSLDDFFVARPGDDAKTINKALQHGQNLLLTPGVYHLDRSLEVKRAGHRRARPRVPDARSGRGQRCDRSARRRRRERCRNHRRRRCRSARPCSLDVSGKGKPHKGDPADPTTLSDVFFRIGGPAAGKATTALVVNSDNVILDDIWAWRADHGNGVGWDVNTADTGVIVKGDDVTAYGLFVEHFQRSEVIWNGEAWSHDHVPERVPVRRSRPGVVDARRRARVRRLRGRPHVKTHEAWGVGSYCLLQRQSLGAREPRLRGAGDAGREDARPPHGEPQRRHDRPRRQRHRRPGHDGRDRCPRLHHGIPVSLI